jgi:hypothetical protein
VKNRIDKYSILEYARFVMNWQLEPTEQFERDAKRYAKKTARGILGCHGKSGKIPDFPYVIQSSEAGAVRFSP